MSATPHEGVDPKEEYKSLRDELLQSKRYVFERPLLIAALGVAGAKADALFVIYPPILASLLLFNFWFTVNRLLSSARIVAYIQLVLEAGVLKSSGWETSLHEYREWFGGVGKTDDEKKDDRKKKVEIVDEKLRGRQTTDSLQFYRPILRLHLLLVIAAGAASITVAFVLPGPVSAGCAVITWIVVAVSPRYAFRWKPSRMQEFIDRNRIIWKLVLAQREQPKPEDTGPEA